MWVDIRPLAHYPQVHRRRGAELRTVSICRNTIVAWRWGMVSAAELSTARKRIQQAALDVADCDPFAPLPTLEAEPAPVEPAAEPVPQDEFLSALASVFG